MRKILLLLVVAAGLVSFKKDNEERDAYIIKAIEGRVREAKMDIKNIRIVQVRSISERDYEEHIIRGGMESVSANMEGSIGFAKVDKDWEKKFEEKLATLSDEKGYGYYVKVKCYLKGGWFGDGKRTMQILISEKAGTDLTLMKGHTAVKGK